LKEQFKRLYVNDFENLVDQCETRGSLYVAASHTRRPLRWVYTERDRSLAALV